MTKLNTVEKRDWSPENIPKKTLTYIHKPSIGCSEACQKIIHNVHNLIHEIYNSNQVSGISMNLIKSYDNAQEQFVLNIDQLLNYKNLEYPFIRVHVSPITEYFETIHNFLVAEQFELWENV